MREIDKRPPFLFLNNPREEEGDQNATRGYSVALAGANTGSNKDRNVGHRARSLTLTVTEKTKTKQCTTIATAGSSTYRRDGQVGDRSVESDVGEIGPVP